MTLCIAKVQTETSCAQTVTRTCTDKYVSKKIDTQERQMYENKFLPTFDM